MEGVEDRAIRDVMVELANDSKLRKDALDTKDLSLTALLKEGEANELVRSRAATVEGKSIHRLSAQADKELTDEEAEVMIARLKSAGKYSNRLERVSQKEAACNKQVYQTKTSTLIRHLLF